ncbi:MAG: T9SS type A sorting domain-containing protein [bacterium]|nr:T9SS type A sorting domain-containing protein [bacterium]
MEKGKYHISFIRIKILFLLIIGLFIDHNVLGQSFNELASGKTVISEYSLEFDWSIAAPTGISGKVGDYIINSNVGLTSVQIIVENDEVESINEPLFFPNPFLTELRVSGAEGWKVEFVDQQGKLHGTISLVNGTNFIDTSSWNNGLYFVKIKADNEVFVKKILKVD